MAVNKLGWKHEYTFETMLDEMIDYWLDKFNNDNRVFEDRKR